MNNCILIGDSIRLGYQETVESELAGQAEFWKPEENGGTSANVLAHLDEWVISRKPDVVHINCGLHDIARSPENNKNTRVSFDDYQKNVRTIFERVRNETDALLLWARTTPVIEVRHNSGRKGFDRLNADIDQYNAAVDAIAAEMNVPVNDLNKVVLDADYESFMTEDGVHYLPEGSALLGRAVAAFIKAHAGV